jgi:DNA primase
MQVKECDFKTALKYVCEILNIRIDTFSAPTQGFVSNYTKADWDIFERFDRLQNGIKTKEELESYNENILNLYSDLYYEGWIEENISIESMKKYHIKYDIVNERIIIPHFDINNNLIGIRCRNLNPMAEAKYCPIYIETVPYTHSLSCNLYGLNRNKEVIKSMKKVMIVESEKSTLQAETYFPNNNFVVACCGSSISNEQIQLLLTLGVEEVILGMDWDF